MHLVGFFCVERVLGVSSRFKVVPTSGAIGVTGPGPTTHGVANGSAHVPVHGFADLSGPPTSLQLVSGFGDFPHGLESEMEKFGKPSACDLIAGVT